MSRTLAVGDVHGCLAALEAVIEAAGVGAGDKLVMLGDYTSRGSDGREVLEWVCERAEAGGVVPLRGNHEVMMLAAAEDLGAMKSWLAVGGDATAASYGENAPQFGAWDAAVPSRHWRLLREGLRPYFETDSHVFVHANLYPTEPLEEQPDVMLYWESFDSGCGAGMTPLSCGRTMVCGHSIQRSGWPAVSEAAVCIDTGAGLGGWLTCLDVDSGEFWQAGESGGVRGGRL